MKLKYNELIFDMNGDVNLDNYYTKSECDNKYALKSHSHSNYATTSDLNSVRNTANNALNVANSKSKLDIYNSSQAIGTSPGYEPSSYTPPKNGCQNLYASYSGRTLYQRGVPLLNGSTVLVAANYPITVDRGGMRGTIYFI